MEVRRYWSPSPGRFSYRRDEDYVEHFRDLLREAVRERLRAKGPVACWISGGLDSSSITSMAAHIMEDEGRSGSCGNTPRSPIGTAHQGLTGKAPRRPTANDLYCLTSIFPGLDCDEEEYAREVSAMYELPHKFIACTNEGLLDTAAGCLRNQATPFLTPDPVLFKRMLDETRAAGTRVGLMGLGGDEILASETFFYHLFARRRWSVWWRELTYFRRPGPFTALRVILHFAWMTSPPILRWNLGRSGRGLRALLGPAPSRARSPWRWFGLCPDYEADAPIPWLKRPGPSDGFMGNLLGWRDRFTFGHQVEMRYPFFDRRLIEFMLDVPDHLFHHRGYSKSILREAMRGILPDKVARRRTYAEFSRFFDTGLRGHDGDELSRIFGGELACRRYLRVNQARRLAEDYLAGKQVDRWRLWSVVALELWLRTHGHDERVTSVT